MISQRLYIGRDTIISSRVGLKHTLIALKPVLSFPHHLNSNFIHTRWAGLQPLKQLKVTQRCITALVKIQTTSWALRKASLNLRPCCHCIPGGVWLRLQIPGPSPCTGRSSSSLIHSCNGSQGSHMNGGVIFDGSWFVQFQSWLTHIFRACKETPLHSGVLSPYHLVSWCPKRWFYHLHSVASCFSTLPLSWRG